MKNLLEPSLLFRFATVLSGFSIITVEVAQGRKVDSNVFNLLGMCLIDLAVEAGISVEDLKAETERLLRDPEAAIREAKAGGKTANDLPC